MCRWCHEPTTTKRSTRLIKQIHEVEQECIELQSLMAQLREQRGRIVKAYARSHESTDFIRLVRLGGALLPHILMTIKWQVQLLWLRNRRSSLSLSIAMQRPGLFGHLFPFNRVRAQRIVSPPGRRLLRVAEFFFSPKTVTLTFKPLIADWQFEYFDALKEKRGKWHLRMMTLRNYWYYAKACGLSKIAKFFKGFARQ
jgi:hypothetical protein